MHNVRISDQFLTDIRQLKKEDSKLSAKVWELISNILENIHSPLEGIGKPEALKGDLSGYASRRITDKHRLIYRVADEKLDLVSCYGHYDDK